MSDMKHNNMGPVRPVDDEAKAVSIYTLPPKRQNGKKRIHGILHLLNAISYFTGLP